MQIISTIKNYAFNIPGWRTKRKIVVIESDDWGSIRMPSRDVYQRCLKAGYPVDQDPYERYDSLLSKDDIELLFETLGAFQDANGNHPVITANCAVANPNYRKIKQDDYYLYHYELITETFKQYPKHGENFQLWRNGINQKLFMPQFHAREHLNVSRFMLALQKQDRDVHWAFMNQMPGIVSKSATNRENAYVRATNFVSQVDKLEKLKIYMEGLDLFSTLFGFNSISITPTNYIWSPDYDIAIKQKGVHYIQGNRAMIEPVPPNDRKIHRRYMGQRNKANQINLVRNVLFEPSNFTLKVSDPVGRCLSDMSIAFRLQKPAIISSHRLNYAGFIDERNRDTTLGYLKQVLKCALEKWPDIEFMTSCELGEIIKTS